MSFGEKTGVTLIVAAILAVIGLVFWRYTFLGYVDNYEIGYVFHGTTGQIEPLDRKGYIPIGFWDSVGTIDGRPMQVCINANSRVLNCKLVQFDPRGLSVFLAWHGRDWASSVKSTGEASPLAEILKSYAYDGTGNSYSFLRVLRELKMEQGSVTPAPQASVPK